jgi:hypothetical protein
MSAVSEDRTSCQLALRFVLGQEVTLAAAHPSPNAALSIPPLADWQGKFGLRTDAAGLRLKELCVTVSHATRPWVHPKSVDELTTAQGGSRHLHGEGFPTVASRREIVDGAQDRYWCMWRMLEPIASSPSDEILCLGWRAAPKCC